jgi:outer membrane protein OmpA-like peptidoglycan-associated protein
LSKEEYMKRSVLVVLTILIIPCLTLSAAAAQEGSRAGAVTKSIKAIGYQVGGGSTEIDLKATTLLPGASGEAKVEAKQGTTAVEVKYQYMAQPTKFGAEFLTFVLWAVSPEGRASNLGELLIDKNGKGELKASTQMAVFSLLVTAEPYFAVRQPSELVVLENEIRKNTKGKVFVVNDYKLLTKAQYQKLGNPLSLSLDLKNVPLEMYEARNAVDISKSRGAEKYAADIYAKAEASLKMAENALARKSSRTEIVSTARQAVQFSEDARALAVQRQEEERIAQEREAAAAKAKAQAEAKAAAEAAEAKRKADEETRRQAEVSAAREAQMKAEAEAATIKAKVEADAAAARIKAEADAAAAKAKAEADAAATKAKAEQDALRAKEEAAKAEAERARQDAERAEREKQELRARLLDQLNRILETRDTPRGLVVTMADVLFDTGKYDLRPTTREKLARLAGIVLANPGLVLQVEGHTDSTGSDELNQKLSEQRAGTTRDYLIQQGLDAGSITAKGFGKTMPVADNSTADGRQKNRRVELIVSGEVIGTAIGTKP